MYVLLPCVDPVRPVSHLVDPHVEDEVVLQVGEESPGQEVLPAHDEVQALQEEALLRHKLDEVDVKDGLAVQHHPEERQQLIGQAFLQGERDGEKREK